MAESVADNSKKTAKKPRGKPFEKGVSGNPGGRPKQTAEQKDALQAIRELTNKAADVLEKMLTDEKIPPAQRLKAAEMILDRTYGKAEAKVNMDAKVVSGDFVLRIGAEDDAADS